MTAVPPAPVEAFGLRFPNPVGLAAGMDKDGVALAAWPALGFGFVEVGTVTGEPQPLGDGAQLVISNSFGFGGHNAVAAFRSY